MHIQLNDELVEFIESNKISSIQMIASRLGLEEENVRQRLIELMNDGLIEGTLTEDGSRFFLASVKVSDAPAIRSNTETIVIEYPDTSMGKYTALAGLASIIGGFILRGLSGLMETLANIGAASILLGIALLAGGWLYISRKQVSIA